MDIAERSHRAAASLGRWLAPLTFRDWPAPEVTAALTGQAAAWGSEHGWTVDRGVPSIAGDLDLDLVCRRPDGPPIAIEIDRPGWSPAKLLCEAEAGAVVVWLRWCPDIRGVPPPIAMVSLETSRRSVDGRALYSLPGAPAEQHQTCTALTKKGLPCINGARPSGLCHIHDPAVQCGAVNRRGKRCGVATGGGRCRAHQDVDGSGPGLFPRIDGAGDETGTLL